MTASDFCSIALVSTISLLLAYLIRKQVRQYGILYTTLIVIVPTALILLDVQNPLFKNLDFSRIIQAYFSYPKFVHEIIQLILVHSYVCFLFGMTYLLFFFIRRIAIPLRLMLVLPFFSYICLYYLFFVLHIMLY